MINGAYLPEIFESEALSEVFAEVLQEVKSIIVFRSSPAQKARIVNFIKTDSKFGSPVTASIGDGANDVNMI